MPPQPSRFVALLQIFRFEYVLAALPGMTITFFLCARSAHELWSVPVVEGMLMIALLMFASLGINAVVDRDIDQKYASAKKRIPAALARLGAGPTVAIVVAQALIALGLALHLSMHFHSWFPIAWYVIEALLAFGYSVPPLHFKVRGVLPHGLSLLLASGIMPFALSVYTYLGDVPVSSFVFITGFALVQYGFEFSNQALDYLEDRAEGLQTPAVRLGLLGSLRASLWVPLTGMLIAFVGMYWLISERFASLAGPHSQAFVLATWLVALFAMVLGYLRPLRNTWHMYLLCRSEPPEQCVPKLPALCRYALWQASSVAGVAAGSAVLFIAAAYLL